MHIFAKPSSICIVVLTCILKLEKAAKNFKDVWEILVKSVFFLCMAITVIPQETNCLLLKFVGFIVSAHGNCRFGNRCCSG